MDFDYSKDKSNMQKVLLDYPDQISKALLLAQTVAVPRNLQKIAVTGMGGSAFPGEVLKCYLKKDIIISRDYTLPDSIDKNTLLFVISYSGNTEETVSAYKHGLRIGAKCIVITSGGKLEEISKVHNHPSVIIPGGIQPRDATNYMFFAMLKVLELGGYAQNANTDIAQTIKALKNPFYQQMAKELVDRLYGKIPLIYTSHKLECVARRWKIGFNENSKVHAFYNIFPELNHNEIVGFTHCHGPFYAIFIRDQEEEKSITRRMDLTKELIKQAGVPVIELGIKGECFLARLFSAMYIGIWLSYYLALKNGEDPTPVAIIEQLKEKLKKG